MTDSSRRAFLRRSATLLLAGTLPLPARAAPDARAGELAYFLRIAADGTVLFQLTKHEMGQGVAGSLAAVLAEELGADWRRVRVEFIDYDPRYRYNTGGSSTMPGMYRPLRLIGAQARERLVEAAANRFGVPATQCMARDSVVIDTVSGRSAGFGELAPLARPDTAVPLADVLARPAPPLKPAAAFTLIGKPLPNATHAPIVRGALRYSSDVRVDGMLYAVVARCPVFRGRLLRVDDRAALRVPGVRQVVRVPPYLPPGDVHNEDTTWAVHEGVAVLADTTWAAMRGRDALVLEWDGGANARHSYASYRDFVAQQLQLPGRQAFALGDRAVLAGAAERFSADYEYPYQPHACMETMNCTAHVRGDGSAELWIATQNTGHIVSAAKQVLGLDAARVAVHHFPSGGSFGRRYYPDVAVEALQVSRAAGNVPVKVMWTREDDMRHDHFHFHALQRYEAALDADGRLAAVHFKDASTGHVGSGPFWFPYDVPHRHHDVVGLQPHALLRHGAWRSVTNNGWGLSQECFMDEAAQRAGADPLAFRLRHLQADTLQAGGRPISPARLRKVLEAAAERAGWGKKLAPGRALGIACYAYAHANAYCAHVAEVSVADGRLTVHRVVCALDCGLVVNPDAVRAQIEGNLVWGLSAVFGEPMRVEAGRVQNANFHDFPILRISGMPQLETILIEGDDKPGGAGETSLPSVVPAVLNAVHAATGRRVRKVPLTRGDLA